KLPYFHRDRIFLISLCQLTAIATFPISIAITFLNSVISTNCDRNFPYFHRDRISKFRSPN
ncbi:MAG: hypothetical protein ACKO2V_02755, partial [Snowella sp.]